MTDAQVSQAYAARAAEYTAVLGAVDKMHELDRHRIERWAERISGRVIDAGCGPGHWTNFLHQRGLDIEGVDFVPEFIESARTRFPDASFRVSSLRALGVPDGSLNGVLAWYSLIHLDPEELPVVLSELARTLASQGHLLVGFFEGASAEPFEHAITTAYYWSLDQMSHMLQTAGFEVLDVERRQDPGNRPHAAIAAMVR
ncbi:class I SAM-dependent methyltransferase [Salinibacterium sp. ZJ454]|uniref:class I SAM-dependent methyltransferase n=1 Tax=Salinibacterium sp. ZJ454 TaxID=2708339 RepID=UPI0014206560|nr:class I SAM-dependent methyltransferase [Salinibacterium sp. ZJ454]